MVLRLSRTPGAVTFEWNGDQIGQMVRDVAERTLMIQATSAVNAIKDDPDTPVDTGQLSASIRLAPPGYSGDDTGIAGPQGPKGDEYRDYVDLGRQYTGKGLSRKPNYTARMTGLAAHHGGTLPEGNAKWIVWDGERASIWVGSFVKYAWYVHQGAYNVWAGRFIPGRPYIWKHTDRLMKNYGNQFKASWQAEVDEMNRVAIKPRRR